MPDAVPGQAPVEETAPGAPQAPPGFGDWLTARARTDRRGVMTLNADRRGVMTLNADRRVISGRWFLPSKPGNWCSPRKRREPAGFRRQLLPACRRCPDERFRLRVPGPPGRLYGQLYRQQQGAHFDSYDVFLIRGLGRIFFMKWGRTGHHR